MKRTSHLQGGFWRVLQQWFPEWGSRLIQDSYIVVSDPYSSYCDSVGFIDLTQRFDFFFLMRKWVLLFLKLFVVGVDGHLPYLFQIVCCSQQSLAISIQSQHTTLLGRLCFATGTDNFLFQFTCNDLALQVSDLDAGPVAAEPVAVGTEALGTRDVPTI